MQAKKPETNWQIESQQQAAGAKQIQQMQQNVGVDNANLLKMFGAPQAQGQGFSIPALVGGSPTVGGLSLGAMPSLASMFGGGK
jgi:hypothetical protein